MYNYQVLVLFLSRFLYNHHDVCNNLSCCIQSISYPIIEKAIQGEPTECSRRQLFHIRKEISSQMTQNDLNPFLYRNLMI